MSWITSPQNLTFLTLPLLNMNSNYLMVGQNADNNLFAYQVSGKGWIISNTVGYNYKMNGNRILKPIFQDVNGYCYWTDNYYYLYYELKFGWILINGKFPGYTPMEYQYRNDKGETFWGGDNFYTGSLPSESGSTSFSLRGALRNNSSNKPITLEMDFNYWQKEPNTSSPYGVYYPHGNVTGEKMIGLPEWIDDKKRYTRSLKREDNGHYRYGDIHYDKGKWLIGSVGDTNGWWEGDEPKVNQSTVFRFMKNEDSEVIGSNKTIFFDKYVAGEEKRYIYIGEAAIWR